jgi:CheY-like chemotaxis protein
VLVVDDSEVIRGLIAMNLELDGLDVQTAADGVEALEKVGTWRPDVVTLDVMMPRLDGFATAQRLKGDATTSALPIVIVSACAQEADLRRAKEIGVEAYLTKPFDPDDLVRIVRELADGGTVVTDFS